MGSGGRKSLLSSSLLSFTAPPMIAEKPAVCNSSVCLWGDLTLNVRMNYIRPTRLLASFVVGEFAENCHCHLAIV